MPRSDRLLRLLHVMRTMPAPLTAARLAGEMGISVRSLYRDINALRAAGARIAGEPGFGYRLEEDPALPPQMLEQDEIEALTLGLAEVRSWGDPVLARASSSVLAKLAATLPEARERELVHAIARVFNPEPRYAAPVDLTPLRAACRQEQAVRIRYRDGDDTFSERVILPLALVYAATCVVVLAWCELRKDFRMFRTDRIADLQTDHGSFRPRRVAMLRDYVARLQKRRGATIGSG